MISVSFFFIPTSSFTFLIYSYKPITCGVLKSFPKYCYSRYTNFRNTRCNKQHLSSSPTTSELDSNYYLWIYSYISRYKLIFLCRKLINSPMWFNQFTIVIQLIHSCELINSYWWINKIIGRKTRNHNWIYKNFQRLNTSWFFFVNIWKTDVYESIFVLKTNRFIHLILILNKIGIWKIISKISYVIFGQNWLLQEIKSIDIKQISICRKHRVVIKQQKCCKH